MWVRGGAEDEQLIGRDSLQKINEKSLAPLIDHGDKKYMVALGMAKLIESEEDMDFGEPCCIKPLHGSKGKDVQVWMPKPDGSRDTSCVGGATRSQVIRAIKSGACIRQPFIQTGTHLKDGAEQFKLMRLFAVINDSMEFEIIPSPYVMRPNVKIHGASDAVNGLITFT